MKEPGRTVYVYPSQSNIQLTNQGGTVVRSARLEVLFWGDQWQQPAARDVADAITAILSTPYLSEKTSTASASSRRWGSDKLSPATRPEVRTRATT